MTLYRSPNQSKEQFDLFSNNFELNLEKLAQKNPFLRPVLGDFNVKSSSWFKRDKTTTEVNQIENISSQLGVHRTINEPMHILDNSFSCIYIIHFTA